MLFLLSCGLLAFSSVLGEEVDFSEIEPRVFWDSKTEVRYPFTDASPEIDSTEHGVGVGARKTSCICGVAHRQAQSRIVNGRETTQFEYPFLAAISYSLRPTRPHCGGVIISSNHVITAAHCTEKAVGGITVFVTLGEYHKGMTPGAYTIEVTKLIQHEKYNPANLKDDISLLYMKNPLIMSGAVSPACMPLPGLDVTGKYVRVIGWGATRFKGAGTLRPRKVDLRVIDTLLCNKMWPDNVNTSPKTQICTMSRDRTTCQGDSGGPVVWLDPETKRYTIVGLVSAGPRCNFVKPTVHTSVVHYLPWIMKGIEATTPSRKLCTKV